MTFRSHERRKKQPGTFVLLWLRIELNNEVDPWMLGENRKILRQDDESHVGATVFSSETLFLLFILMRIDGKI